MKGLFYSNPLYGKGSADSKVRKGQHSGYNSRKLAVECQIAMG